MIKNNRKLNTTLIIVGIVIATFFALNLAYPAPWNNFADKANDRLEGVHENLQIPRFVERDYFLGLDLQGGLHLVYEADLSEIAEEDRDDAMDSIRDTLERRIDFLGVSEPRVQAQRGPNADRLIIELPGVEDPDEAVRQIGETPFLEFRELRPAEEQEEILQEVREENELFSEIVQDGFCQAPSPDILNLILETTEKDPCFQPTELTGQYLDRASVVVQDVTGNIQVSLRFDDEGAVLFEELTERSIGSPLAIYLDQEVVSSPQVNEAIFGGEAVITGDFSREEAQNLARNLNAGALPVPIDMVSQQRVGATLGEESLQESLYAGLFALAAVLVFLVVIYRFSGFLAVLSLVFYMSFLLLLIKLIPVTLTLAGIAGLILSIGLAVDANILIFERLREELQKEDNTVHRAVDKAFERAWPSIRDGNISTLITAVILFYFSTSFVQGFALVLALGILISMFSAVLVTRYLIEFFLNSKKLEQYKFIWRR